MERQRLKEALVALGYKESEIQLENAGSGKLGGVLITESFEGVSQEDRQQQLWDGLRGKLSPDELIQIVAIMTMTPNEIAA